jgi:hypothetical protein
MAYTHQIYSHAECHNDPLSHYDARLRNWVGGRYTASNHARISTKINTFKRIFVLSIGRGEHLVGARARISRLDLHSVMPINYTRTPGHVGPGSGISHGRRPLIHYVGSSVCLANEILIFFNLQYI